MTANNGVMAWKERLVQVLYIMVGLVIAFPILYALMISFMDPAQVLAGGVNLIPNTWTLENYRTALNSAPIMRFYVELPDPGSYLQHGPCDRISSGSFCLCISGFSM